MVQGRNALRAISNPPRLQDVVERQAVRDALRADLERARCQDLDLTVSETSRAAAILDRCRASGVLQYLRAAVLRPMLETRKRRHIADALVDWRLRARRSIDLPHSWLRLRERREQLPLEPTQRQDRK